MKELRTAFQNLMPERRHLVSDLIAGLTFAVVNVPQAMGHALLATVNPVLGIYTLMVAAPVAALSTCSVFMNVSTTAALLVAAAADLAGVPESDRGEALAVLVLLVGGFQLAAGVFRLGFLVRFVSNAVMTGFLNGVAALIVLGQLGRLTGFDSDYANQAARALDLFVNLGHVNVEASRRRWNSLGALDFTNGSNQHNSCWARCSMRTTFQSIIRMASMSPSSLM
jgi:SulP family sulfate permease